MELIFGCPEDETYFNSGYPDGGVQASLGIQTRSETVAPGGTGTGSTVASIPRFPSHCAHGRDGKLLLGLTGAGQEGNVAGTVSIPDYGYQALPLPFDVLQLIKTAPPA
jgi:hypothetical protein